MDAPGPAPAAAPPAVAMGGGVPYADFARMGRREYQRWRQRSTDLATLPIRVANAQRQGQEQRDTLARNQAALANQYDNPANIPPAPLGPPAPPTFQPGSTVPIRQAPPQQPGFTPAGNSTRVLRSAAEATLSDQGFGRDLAQDANARENDRTRTLAERAAAGDPAATVMLGAPDPRVAAGYLAGQSRERVAETNAAGRVKAAELQGSYRLSAEQLKGDAKLAGIQAMLDANEDLTAEQAAYYRARAVSAAAPKPVKPVILDNPLGDAEITRANREAQDRHNAGLAAPAPTQPAAAPVPTPPAPPTQPATQPATATAPAPASQPAYVSDPIPPSGVQSRPGGKESPPVRVSSPEEAARLPKGTKFIDHTGQMRTRI